jgi:peptidoglycan/LPS O-acetylase OafA/YrhL
LSFVLVGFICIASPALMDSLERNRRTSLVLAFVTLVFINYLRWNKLEPSDTSSWAMYAYISIQAFTAWFWVMSIIGYGKRYLNKKHRVLNYLNQAVYPFYILHQTVIVVIVYYVVQVNDSILLKYLFTVTLSFIVTMCIYHLFIRPYALMRFLFGMKPKEKVTTITKEQDIAMQPSAIAI